MTNNKKAVTYKSSGVDIAKANAFVRNIQGMVASTANGNVLKRTGAFGSLFKMPHEKFNTPVLVSSTDGVGTKLLLAKLLGKHDTVGIDLVAMNVNDILCTGAKPLYFLDYIACGTVKPKVLQDVVKGITEGCRQAGCSLVGGETAEMPGLYKKNDYDLAGFAVGIVEEINIIDGSAMEDGDRIIGLASSGLHSNGFSLARKVLSVSEQKKYAKALLEPTRIYVKPVLAVLDKFQLKGIAHNTGGAFYEKLTKIVPRGKCLAIDKRSWSVPEIFQLIQSKGKVADQEMYHTFNMGIGMILVAAPYDVPAIRQMLTDAGVESWEIGEVTEDTKRKIKL